MTKLVIECPDDTLLAHLMRGLLVDLGRLHIKAKSPNARRAIETALKTARIERK